MTDPTAEHVRAVGRALLEDLDSLVDKILARRPQVQGFEALPLRDHRQEVQLSARVTIEAIFIVQEMKPEFLAMGEPILEQRARVGIPRDAWVRALYTSLEELWRASADIAEQLGYGAEVQSRIGALLLEGHNAMVEAAIEMYRRFELESAELDHDRRTRFLHDLFSGSLARWDLVSEAAAYRLSRTDRYVPFRARGLSADDTVAMQRHLATFVRANGGLIGTMDGDIVGIAAGRIEVGDVSGAVGVGEAAEITCLHDEFIRASRALDTATAFGLRGVFDMDALGFRWLMFGDEDLGPSLDRKFLEPLRSQGTFGVEVEETVAGWLRNRMRLRATARTLHIHPNTLRHRLERFEQLTGADLSSIEDLLGTWWALARRDLVRGTLSADRATD